MNSTSERARCTPLRDDLRTREARSLPIVEAAFAGDMFARIPSMDTKAKSETPAERVAHLRWLEDSPLFSDPVQIARFHDAVVRPEWITGQSVWH